MIDLEAATEMEMFKEGARFEMNCPHPKNYRIFAQPL